MKKYFSMRLVYCLVLLYGSFASADFNHNAVGIVTEVLTYTTNQFLFKLSSMPETTCPTPGYFSVSAATTPDADARNRIFAGVMASKILGTKVQVGTDNVTASCDNGRPIVYLLGLIN